MQYMPLDSYMMILNIKEIFIDQVRLKKVICTRE